MQTCPNCNHVNRPGVVFCDNCGASLIGDAPLSTKNFAKLPDASSGLVDSSVILSAGTDIFPQGTLLRLEIDGAEPLLLKPLQETIFGRRDPATGAMPDVDLTPFAGYRMGVSRRHAAIRRSESGDRLDLWDLGSSNGTYLNGQRLLPHRPNSLHDGDEIRLGQMLMKIYFQPAPKTGMFNPTSPQNAANISTNNPSSSLNSQLAPKPLENGGKTAGLMSNPQSTPKTSGNTGGSQS